VTQLHHNQQIISKNSENINSEKVNNISLLQEVVISHPGWLCWSYPSTLLSRHFSEPSDGTHVSECSPEKFGDL